MTPAQETKLTKTATAAREATLDRDRQIRALYAAGASYRQLAGPAGLTHTGIRRIILKGANGSTSSTAPKAGVSAAR